MGEGELIIALVSIISLFVLMPATLLFGILKIQQQRAAMKASNSVGMKELESAMEVAMVRATLPLQERLDRLEEQLNRIEGSAQSLLDVEWAREETTGPAEKTMGRSKGRQGS